MRDRGCVTSKLSIAYNAKARHKAARATETKEEVGGGVGVVAKQRHGSFAHTKHSHRKKWKYQHPKSLIK